MAIAFGKYVQITSGVSGASQVAQRDLMARQFTTNELVPTKTVLEFSNAEDVGLYFGTSTEEFKRSSFYFGRVSKLITVPNAISFYRYAETATAPQIFGQPIDQDLSVWQGIADGGISITIGAQTEDIDGINFASVISLDDVATVLQIVINGANVDPVWSAATVVYNVTRKSFDFTGGDVGVNSISVGNTGVGTDIAALLGWLNFNTILSNGVALETPVESVSESASLSNNFGSFSFLPALSLDDIVSVAEWNSGRNVEFQYHVPVLISDAPSYSNALFNIGGVGLTLHDNVSYPDEYPELIPMNILASTDYRRANANQNYMFQQFNITPLVSSTLESDSLDSLRVNYYGQTQTAGRGISFYQRGLLFGLSSDPLDMNVYANEQWLKDANGVSIMELLLALSALPANDTGRIQVLSILQPNIEQAKTNGTISPGKTLTPTQIATVTSISNDENAWRQVQGIGYWIDATVFESATNPGEFIISYLLIYAKGDAVRKVEGTHTLI